ncbi:MAG: hypothetical protein RLZZ606_937, partial [Actinomycetota bacterium]
VPAHIWIFVDESGVLWSVVLKVD